jgi:hypothetical protein
MTTVISEHATVHTARARAEGDDLWIDNDALEPATGWSIKPEGLCHGPICVPVPRDAAGAYVRDGAVNIAAF